jgi:hypothetical protein
MKKKKVKKTNTITIGKPRVRKPIAKKVVVKKAIVKPKPVVKEYLSARYSFDIISIQTDAVKRIVEIGYTYTGTLLIPKSLKSSNEPNSISVSGTYLIKASDNNDILDKDIKSLNKKEVVVFLKDSLRDDYISGMRDIIAKELFPGLKKNEVLPW